MNLANIVSRSYCTFKENILHPFKGSVVKPIKRYLAEPVKNPAYTMDDMPGNLGEYYLRSCKMTVDDLIDQYHFSMQGVKVSRFNRFINALPVVGCVYRNDAKITDVLRHLGRELRHGNLSAPHQRQESISYDKYNEIIRSCGANNIANRKALDSLTDKLGIKIEGDRHIGFSDVFFSGEMKAAVQLCAAAVFGYNLVSLARSAAGSLNSLDHGHALTSGIGFGLSLFYSDINGAARCALNYLKNSKVARKHFGSAMGYCAVGSMIYSSLSGWNAPDLYQSDTDVTESTAFPRHEISGIDADTHLNGYCGINGHRDMSHFKPSIVNTYSDVSAGLDLSGLKPEILAGRFVKST